MNFESTSQHKQMEKGGLEHLEALKQHPKILEYVSRIKGGEDFDAVTRELSPNIQYAIEANLTTGVEGENSQINDVENTSVKAQEKELQLDVEVKLKAEKAFEEEQEEMEVESKQNPEPAITPTPNPVVSTTSTPTPGVEPMLEVGVYPPESLERKDVIETIPEQETQATEVQENIPDQITAVDEKIKAEQEKITATVAEINVLRDKLGLPPSHEIPPSAVTSENAIADLTAMKAELEDRLKAREEIEERVKNNEIKINVNGDRWSEIYEESLKRKGESDLENEQEGLLLEDAKYPEVPEQVWEAIRLDLESLPDSYEDLEYKAGDVITLAVNSDTPIEYDVFEAKNGHYFLAKRNPDGDKMGEYFLSTEEKTGVNPDFMVCSAQEVEQFMNNKKSELVVNQDVEKTIIENESMNTSMEDVTVNVKQLAKIFEQRMQNGYSPLFEEEELIPLIARKIADENLTLAEREEHLLKLGSIFEVRASKNGPMNEDPDVLYDLSNNLSRLQTNLEQASQRSDMSSVDTERFSKIALETAHKVGDARARILKKASALEAYLDLSI